ncbi:S-layer homology domain-containing protein [Lysinibacillus sp. FJAT-14745]|uniref:S-layer homology domain-containing protein n=1 Tax=Lysinibacillus sp. FJAT-14745 TaxID=1704289 RepID=UPI0009E7FE99|nr:S-layer homology domain-containing protein [Lysinibacillus sp. FJAT-14745]
MKKLSIIALLMTVIGMLLWQPQLASADELTGHSHEQGLRYLISKNALVKDAKGSYRPNVNVTRGEFAAYLAKSMNLEATSDIVFKDVPDKYVHAKDIKLAASAGIITGYGDGSFKPNAAISRQHMAVMLERAIDYLNIPKGTPTITFKDNASIIKEYRQAVAIGAQLEIIKGSNGSFMPTKNATIGQAATFVHRLMTLAGNSNGGNSNSGNTNGGNTNGGNTNGGDTNGGNTNGGNTNGGNTNGGNTNGGNTNGGDTNGGNTNGGNTNGGNTNGGNTNGGNTNGGNTNGGNTNGGNTNGGNTNGGNTNGGNTNGDNTNGGNTNGGDTNTGSCAYAVKEISNGALVGNQGFSTFEAAEKAVTKNTQVIVQNDKIVKMSSGYVVTNNYVALKSETINDSIAVAANTEMEYLSSDATQVKVRLAGQIGYLKHADVTLIPFSMSKGRSYYSNENGEIKHTLYDYKTNKYSSSYVFGKAPSFMKPGEKYYSWNGIYFANGNGSSDGEAYNYYQFLPVRAQTQYTAQEIDAYIMNKLAEVESTGVSRYKDATKKSKLIGLGQTLKDVEAKSQINAMLVLSLAQHESAYGMSDQAQDLNNLFGLYVYDTNPLNKKFESVADNINELVDKFLQPNYITPGGSPGKNFSNGAVVGSKALGFNVKYASDPFWGAKIAGHYYRAEKALGFKDANNPYTIGLTTTTGLNVRTGAATSFNPLFTYARSGMPVIITGSATNGWYEVLSDKLYTGTVFVSKDYVQVINTVK